MEKKRQFLSILNIALRTAKHWHCNRKWTTEYQPIGWSTSERHVTGIAAAAASSHIRWRHASRSSSHGAWRHRPEHVISVAQQTASRFVDDMTYTTRGNSPRSAIHPKVVMETQRKQNDCVDVEKQLSLKNKSRPTVPVVTRHPVGQPRSSWTVAWRCSGWITGWCGGPSTATTTTWPSWCCGCCLPAS